MDTRPTLSATDLSTQARGALEPAEFVLLLSPALPSSWPPPSASLEWFAYRNEPLATGVIAYAVSGPVSKVTLGLPAGQPRVEQIRDATVKSDQAQAVLPIPNFATGEQALLDVLTGLRTPEAARAELSVYAEWVDAYPVVGDDLRRRKPEFFRWLEEGRD